MNDKPSLQELRDLVSEAVAIEYLRYRQQGRDSTEPSKDQKPRWLQLLESAGFAAIVTVLIGGLLGGWITSILQDRAKQREQLAAENQLKQTRASAEINDHLERERKVVDEIFLRLGTFVDASRDLASLSRKEFCTDCGHRVAKQVSAQREAIVKHFNDSTEDWDTQRLRLGMLLQLEHNNDTGLLKDWKQTIVAAEEYAQCADRWRVKYNALDFNEAQKACVSVREELDTVVGAFAKRIVDLRKAPATGPSSASLAGNANEWMALVTSILNILLLVFLALLIFKRIKVSSPENPTSQQVPIAGRENVPPKIN